MAQRKEKAGKIKMAHPDRSGPDPSQETLLDIAAKRNLLKAQLDREQELEAEEAEVLVGRVGESVLWSISLTMLHFTLDVLAMNQYAMDINWAKVVKRASQAFPVILILFYTFHPHAEPSMLLPTLPRRFQRPVHQTFFFIVAVISGCYLVYITNTYGYYAVMKQSPPLGCLWIWSVIELKLGNAVAALLVCWGYLKYEGYAMV